MSNTKYPVLYRTYTRKTSSDAPRETEEEAKNRAFSGIEKLANFTPEIAKKAKQYFDQDILFPSGRAFWCAGTEFSEKQENFYSLYNCCSVKIVDWKDFFYNYLFLMMGSGVGAVLEYTNIENLPAINTKLNLTTIGEYGSSPSLEATLISSLEDGTIALTVGDSKEGWATTYVQLLELASSKHPNKELNITIDISHIRAAGELIRGFGGVTNPTGFVPMLQDVVDLLNQALGRQLIPVECSFLLNYAAKCTVAGNVRRSARIDQFSIDDQLAATIKLNLWIQDEDGNWRIDPERDALRMANFTRVWHTKPTLEEVKESLEKQFQSGEGAIMYAPEAIARANADLLDTPERKELFLQLYNESKGSGRYYLKTRLAQINLPENNYGLNLVHEVAKLGDKFDKELDHRMSRYGLNPCAEILGSDFFCVGGQTPLITKAGIDEIQNLIGVESEIWNGESWSKVTPFKTGDNRDLYRVTLSDGTYLDVTDNHKWLVKNRFQKDYKEVTTLDLLNYDGKYKQFTPPYVIGETKSTVDVLDSYFYTLGFTFGDGSYDSKRDVVTYTLFGEKQQLELEGDYVNSYSNENGTLYDYCEWVDNKDLLKLKNTTSEIDIFKYVSMQSDDKILSFISGLADADGSNTNSGGIRIYISKYQNANYLYLLLQKCGFKSSINLMAKRGDITNKGIRSEDIYYIQVTDCQGLPTQRLDTSKGHAPTSKGKNQLINSVIKLEGAHTTYCVTEPIHHTCVFNGSLTKQCNLGEVHLNQLDPLNLDSIKDIFYTAGQSVASLLVHEFDIEKFRYSREIDPIVGVSFTGLFDFFVNLFGVDWLHWWEADRPRNYEIQQESPREFLAKILELPILPNSDIAPNMYECVYARLERFYLNFFKEAAEAGVKDYCEANDFKVPNRCTTVQPAGTKSLLTGASPGWHPPKAARYIRRITFGKNDPVALACIDYGYNVVPAQNDKDENGALLNDPFDFRCTEWLVEIPVETSWANLEGCDKVDINQFSAAAQYDFYMQVQTYYTTHNTSATIEFRENEIDELASLLYENIQNGEGYISAALLARFDANETFPRLPFEPISKEKFEELSAETTFRRKSEDFHQLLLKYDTAIKQEEGPAGCDSSACMMPDVSLKSSADKEQRFIFEEVN